MSNECSHYFMNGVCINDGCGEVAPGYTLKRDTAPDPRDTEITRLREQVAAWRHVAHYYLGDYSDTHTPAECRQEAIRRAPEDGAEVARLRGSLAEAERERDALLAWLRMPDKAPGSRPPGWCWKDDITPEEMSRARVLSALFGRLTDERDTAQREVERLRDRLRRQSEELDPLRAEVVAAKGDRDQALAERDGARHMAREWESRRDEARAERDTALSCLRDAESRLAAWDERWRRRFCDGPAIRELLATLATPPQEGEYLAVAAAREIRSLHARLRDAERERDMLRDQQEEDGDRRGLRLLLVSRPGPILDAACDEIEALRARLRTIEGLARAQADYLEDAMREHGWTAHELTGVVENLRRVLSTHPSSGIPTADGPEGGES